MSRRGKNRSNTSGSGDWLSLQNWAIRLVLWSTEITGLVVVSFAVILLVLGLAAGSFTGSDPMANLLPFLLAVFGVCLGLALCLILWWRLRNWLNEHSVVLVPMLAAVLAIGGGLLVTHDRFHQAYGQFRIMIGGKAEANRGILAHQIYAAYRRYNKGELVKLVKRAEVFREDIVAAAEAFSLDPYLLFGLAAAESSYYPRKSKDGGQGLFQITSVPKKVKKQVAVLLKGEKLSHENNRYNAFVAAATLKNYLRQMDEDSLLGLLAYNIGPSNGGLKFIMDKYKAFDFVSIQPYLQQGPRQYPVRVLSYSLVFRVNHQYGRFLTYEKGSNALRIQKIDIPGLD